VRFIQQWDEIIAEQRRFLLLTWPHVIPVKRIILYIHKHLCFHVDVYMHVQIKIKLCECFFTVDMAACDTGNKIHICI
jgi:hypothetical protein